MKINLLKKESIFLLVLLLVAFFLRFYKLDSLMPFFPDMGLFFLPAKDIIVYGNVPLVGMETSHPWIHHGAHWIYVLSILLWVSNFNPVGPAIFIAILGTFTVLLFYFVVKEMFSKNIAILSAILFASSPLLVLNARIPYHTSPIPFFVILLFYFTYKWIKGNIWIFPAITFMLGVLYNHEITTFVFAIVIGIILIYGFLKKEIWYKKLLNFKLIIASIIGFLIPMTPFILHDLKTGEFGQTFKFAAWVGYRLVKFPLGFIDPRFKSEVTGTHSLPEFFLIYKDLIFSLSGIIAFVILILIIIYTINFFNSYFRFERKKLIKVKKKVPASCSLLFLFLCVGLLGLLFHRVPIDADMLLISPFIIVLTTLTLLGILKNKLLPSISIIIIISVLNIYALLSTSYFTNAEGRNPGTYKDKLIAVDEIIKVSDGKSYNLIGKGELDNFKSFSTPYEYLLWWKGHPPSENEEKLKIIVLEKDDEILIIKQE